MGHNVENVQNRTRRVQARLVFNKAAFQYDPTMKYNEHKSISIGKMDEKFNSKLKQTTFAARMEKLNCQRYSHLQNHCLHIYQVPQKILSTSSKIFDGIIPASK